MAIEKLICPSCSTLRIRLDGFKKTQMFRHRLVQVYPTALPRGQESSGMHYPLIHSAWQKLIWTIENKKTSVSETRSVD